MTHILCPVCNEVKKVKLGVAVFADDILVCKDCLTPVEPLKALPHFFEESTNESENC